ncbi:hypothetical protein [Sphingomonas sp. 8AM]|uniref:hypothetical protein n=1 Tax=Sphingomonas sp. 8AM TaxID=2653170 RepID=UPI0012F46FA7|nr:hypothetical protein [Sphingomonas sp. 8AM]VXC31783.1 hypothetical protein SPHINGO8AM_110025 [Sphingomonas sp. 8AM]
MTSKLMPRDIAPLPADNPVTATDRDGRMRTPLSDLPASPTAGGGLAAGLLLTILFFGLPLLIYCVLTSG